MMDFISENAGLIGLLFFFSYFVATALWVFRPGSKQSYAEKSLIPLKEDQDD